MPELDLIGDVFSACGEDLRQAIQDAELPELDGRPRSESFCKLLSGADRNDFLTGIPKNRQQECLSGLWLLAGDIDRSHTISQDLPSAEGSFLHGIMHRREGDYGNSKYWFRRVGPHHVLDQIADHAGSVYRDPYEFIDACERANDGDHSLESECKRAQWIEWQLLMAFLASG